MWGKGMPIACFCCGACDDITIKQLCAQGWHLASGVKQACLSVFLGCCTDSSECVMQAKVEESTKALIKEVDQAKKEHAVTTSS